MLRVATSRCRIARNEWTRIRNSLTALPVEIEPVSAGRIWEAVLHSRGATPRGIDNDSGYAYSLCAISWLRGVGTTLPEKGPVVPPGTYPESGVFVPNRVAGTVGPAAPVWLLLPTCPIRRCPVCQSRKQSCTIDGSVAAFTEWVRDHRPRMLAVADRYAGRSVTAEDIVQEALLVSWMDRHALQHVTTPGAWLAGVTRNVGRRIARKRQRRERLFRDFCSLCSVDISDFVAKSEPGIEMLIQAVESLPQMQRRILQLMIAKSMSDVEIAEALEMATGTVRVYRHRAVMKLRQLLVG